MKKIFLLFISTLILPVALIAQDAETKIKEKGIVLSSPSSPVANYVNAVEVGNLLFLAGKDQSKVINGYSDLMVEVFGDKGKHARSAVGMYALPFNMAMEIEVIVEIEE